MNLSIIIINFNTRELLRRCLESLEQESRRVKEREIEIIVVDNGSTDDSVKMINEFRKLTNLNNKSVNPLIFKLIENKENLGFAKAINQGIKNAKGEVILLLNSDTQVKRGSLEKLLKFEKKVEPAILGLKMLNPDGTVQGSVFNLPTVKRAIEEFWLGKEGSFSKFAPNSRTPMLVEAVSGGAMAISREVVNKIGLLDERYFMYFEDLDYCRRAKKAGFKVWYLPTAEIVHEHGASGRKIGDEPNQWRRLIPSSKIYYGLIKYYLITGIIKLKNFGFKKKI